MLENSAADTKANASSGWDDVDEKVEVKTEGGTQQDKTADEKTEVKPEDTEEQIFNTKLGRKVEAQRKTLEQVTATNQRLLEAVERLESHLQESRSEKTGDPQERLGDDLYERMCAIEPPPVEYANTPKEQVQISQWERRVSAKLEQQARGAYENAYIKSADTLKTEGGELHAEVVRLITTDRSPYNVDRKTGRGDIDAALNYQTALNALLSGKIKPIGGDTGTTKIAAGVSAQSISATTGKKAPNLSAEAAEYAKHLGYTDDQISEAMDRPIASK